MVTYGASHVGVVVDLAAGSGHRAEQSGPCWWLPRDARHHDELIDIENVHGPRHDDTLLGDGAPT